MKETTEVVLFERVREWVIRQLPVDQNDRNLAAHLSAMDAHDLLIVYHNWQSRIPPAEPRTVHTSVALGNNTLTAQYQDPLTAITQDISGGNPLNKYLSRGIKIAAARPGNNPALPRRRDLDLLLNRWGIHHLHLSTNIEQDGFVTRTGHLLFAVFRQGHAYLLDIMDHGNWTALHPLEVLVREFPNSGAFHTMQGVVSLAYEPEEDELRSLRNHAVNTFNMIDGKAVMPAAGMVSTGTTISATRDSDMLLEAIRHFASNWDNIPTSRGEAEADTSVARPRVSDLIFDIHDTAGAGFFDQHSKRFFALFPSPT